MAILVYDFKKKYTYIFIYKQGTYTYGRDKSQVIPKVTLNIIILKAKTIKTNK